MAELEPSFTENGCTSAQADRQSFSSLVCDEGIAPGVGGELEVTQRGAGANMSVDVASGNAFIQGTESGWQGMYHVSADATENLVVTAADPTDDRIDIVVATVRDSQYSGASDDWILQVVAGTPSPAPSAPTTPDNSFVLAEILVTASAASIVTADITDTRTYYQACTGEGGLLDTLVFTSNDTFTKASYPTMAYLDVEVQAAGAGAGGAAAVADSGGSGGGGGQYTRGTILAAALAASETVTIGAGGPGGGGATGGTSGGNSSFGAHLVCVGGVFGNAMVAPGETFEPGGPGGSGGTPGDIDIPGGSGSYAWGTPTLVTGGKGGDSVMGHGGAERVLESGGAVTLPGLDGTGYGGGGGGALTVSGTNNTGGAGTDGVIIVRVYG